MEKNATLKKDTMIEPFINAQLSNASAARQFKKAVNPGENSIFHQYVIPLVTQLPL